MIAEEEDDNEHEHILAELRRKRSLDPRSESADKDMNISSATTSVQPHIMTESPLCVHIPSLYIICGARP